MSGIKETFGLISEAISTMAESGSDWPYTLAGALLLLTVVAHCAIKISTWIGDNAYSRQQKRLSRLSSLREAKKSHPDVLLEAEIDAEKAKVNRYDAWCRWRQEKAQKHRNELIENKTSVVPEFLRTLVFARPRGDDQFADCTFSPSLDMSR